MARPLAPSQPLPPKAPKFFCANIDAQDRVDDPPDSSVLIDYIRNAYEENVPRDEQLRKEKLFMEGVMVDAHNTDLVCVFVDVPNTNDTTAIVCASICELERRYQDVAEDHIGRPRRPNDTGYYNDHFVWSCGMYPGHPHASLRPGFARICFAFATKSEHSGHIVQQVYHNLKARDTEPGEIINEFQNDMSEHNPGLQRHHDRMIAQLRRFEQRLVVSLTDLELVSLPFDIPCSGSETDNAYDAVEKCLAEANRLPRDNVAHMLHPEEEIPDRKKRTYFMFRTPYETQSGVLDSDLKPIIEGIKKALDKKEEGRKMVLPIKWKGCVVFTKGRIDNIKEWNRSPSNINAVSLDSW
ncbi:hypothetical protein BDV37DRAFT_285150 [Aspergillus pseudonomiae]|uniref:Uncharacterized protein n=1 Tax=Aspergillus pseudonomiae TaxID=1506151 RepID=A0A5N7D6J0_9EURO|nr:uncharacterized protein BDV37DRAFT_285150 [Aspergillus pseudonomiae]KAE8402030.1 hypothetical protein BDV37DRAFT_285150 [Aspergillus pseudonomiae]